MLAVGVVSVVVVPVVVVPVVVGKAMGCPAGWHKHLSLPPSGLASVDPHLVAAHIARTACTAHTVAQAVTTKCLPWKI